MKTAATHRGNCQVCGHQQHVMGVVLAKHGYTVDYGYFQGTCSGSDRKPVQVERTLTDATIKALYAYAEGQDRLAEAMKAGTAHPTRIETGSQFNTLTHKYETVYTDWKNATQVQRTKAIKIAIVQAQNASHGAQRHARDLQAMADKLHGTALVSIEELNQKAPKAPKAVVDVKAAKVVGAFGSKAARKEELDKISRMFEKQTRALQAIYLAIPHDQRTEAQSEVYYAPMYPHQWKARHSAAALKEFPQAAAIVAEIEALVKARDAVKAAP